MAAKLDIGTIINKKAIAASYIYQMLLDANVDNVRFLMAVDADGVHVAIEIKRHGGIDGVEQLTRYCELLNRDPLLKPVRGVFAAQTITPQARVLAQDRGFTCLILDYDDMRDTKSNELRLF